ncbi:MAG TPA: signal peptidase I [Bryobacteraceae bacterium]|nr:signal peptidase I [Bryobacteraceae bacterium]
MDEHPSLQDPPHEPVPQTGPEMPDEPPARTHSLVWSTLSWVRDLAFSSLIAIVLIVFLYQPVRVEGPSMEPALTDQERIFINKFTYKLGLGGIEHSDMVVFMYPREPRKSYIKRVIGLPGDRIRIVSGQVFVNGRPLEENYVARENRDTVSWPPTASGQGPDDREVPAGQYFVLGDHRSSSSDSRSWGWVPRENIFGKAVFIYWPPDKIGRLR